MTKCKSRSAVNINSSSTINQDVYLQYVRNMKAMFEKYLFETVRGVDLHYVHILQCQKNSVTYLNLKSCNSVKIDSSDIKKS